MDGADPVGGSRELARLIDEHGEVLLPELKHEYGISLLDVVSEEQPISPRYVLAHIKYLPMGSAFVAELRGGQQFRGWDVDRYLRAAQINSQRTLSYLYVLAHVPKGKPKPAEPTPWPLPDVKTKSAPKPGSFAFIALARLNAVKKMKEGGV